MNTDGILDFVVEYYIWFLIGGAIILVAIIGFFSEKKKLLPKKEKKVKNKRKKDNINKEMTVKTNNTFVSDNDALQRIQTMPSVENEEQVTEEIEQGSSESENTVTDDSQANQEENFDWFNYGKEEASKESTDVTDENMENMDTTSEMSAPTDVESLENADAENIDNEPKNENSESLSKDENREDLTQKENIESLSKDENQLVEALPDDSIQTIVNDIDKIDKMEFTEDNSSIEDNNSIEESSSTKENNDAEENSTKESTITEENLNDKLDDTMQVSYSQLKEMVEDIIAENEQESSDKAKIDNDENINLSRGNDIIDMSLPNFENTKVNSIDDEDDEDGVWKF